MPDEKYRRVFEDLELRAQEADAKSYSYREAIGLLKAVQGIDDDARIQWFVTPDEYFA